MTPMSTAAKLNVVAFMAYERLGGTEGIDKTNDDLYWANERHPQDEDGDIAYGRMLENQADAWAAQENCPEWAR